MPQPAPSTNDRGPVLVTGGMGFIGSHLVEHLLTEGRDVTVIDDCSTGRAENLDRARRLAGGSGAGRLTEIVGDVSARLHEAGESAGFAAIVHLAAAVGVDLVLREPVRSMHTNIDGTRAVLDYASARGTLGGADAPVVLIASSSEVYGKPATHVFNEDDDVLYGPTVATRWSYACSKAIDEYLALGYHAQCGLRTVVARFFNTVGPRQVGDYGMVLPRFVASALAGRALRVFGDGRQSRCFCDVRDAVRGVVGLLGCPGAVGRVVNLGHDEAIEIGQLAELVISTLDSGSSIEFVPYERAYGTGFEDLRHRRPDLARLRHLIGFRAEVPLCATVEAIASWMREPAHTAGSGGKNT